MGGERAEEGVEAVVSVRGQALLLGLGLFAAFVAYEVRVAAWPSLPVAMFVRLPTVSLVREGSTSNSASAGW